MPHLKINCRERGQGELLLLLHGYGGSVHHWHELAARLEGSYRLVIPNLTHLYLSKQKLTFSEQVDVLAKFLEHNFPKQKVHLAGLSYGGALAWALAHRYPHLVDKTILINPLVVHPVENFRPIELRLFFRFPLNTMAIYLILSTPMGRSFLKKTAQIFRNEKSEGSVAIEQFKGRKLQFIAYMIHHFSWLLRNEDWSQWFESLRGYCESGNCCFIYDPSDLLFDEAAYDKFAKHLNCQNFLPVIGGGHLAPQVIPHKVANHIEKFLKKIAAA